MTATQLEYAEESSDAMIKKEKRSKWKAVKVSENKNKNNAYWSDFNSNVVFYLFWLFVRNFNQDGFIANI